MRSIKTRVEKLESVSLKSRGEICFHIIEFITPGGKNSSNLKWSTKPDGGLVSRGNETIKDYQRRVFEASPSQNVFMLFC